MGNCFKKKEQKKYTTGHFQVISDKDTIERMLNACNINIKCYEEFINGGNLLTDKHINEITKELNDHKKLAVLYTEILEIYNDGIVKVD